VSAAPAPDEGPRRPWWASPPFGEETGAAGVSGGGPLGSETPPPSHDAGGHAAHAHVHVDACQVCPVCSLLRVAGEVRPDLVHHLAEAARHVSLAAKAVLDVHAKGWDRHDGLHHVPLDDE